MGFFEGAGIKTPSSMEKSRSKSLGFGLFLLLLVPLAGIGAWTTGSYIWSWELFSPATATDKDLVDKAIESLRPTVEQVVKDARAAGKKEGEEAVTKIRELLNK
jgi:hypothetical protein